VKFVRPPALSKVYHPAPRDPITEAAARVLAGREGPAPEARHPRRLWLVRELERMIVESPAPEWVYAGCAPNVFFSFEEVRRYTRQCTIDWINLVLVDIEEERRDPVADSSYWEALARLEYLFDHGWPIVRE